MEITISRKLLLPLVSVLGAGALAVSAGIPLSNASESSTGVKLVASDNDAATITVTAIEPGDSVTRKVTIHNSAGISSRLSFAETGEPATYDQGNLHLVIARDGDTLYAGQFGAMGDFAQDLGFIGANDTTTFTFTVSLPDGAPFLKGGIETATASYSWVTARQ